MWFLFALLVVCPREARKIGRARSLVHGTSEVVIVSPGHIVASADSKEVITSMLSDGTSVSYARESCKVLQATRMIAMAAGYIRTDEFDALKFIAGAYRLESNVYDFASRLGRLIGAQLRQTWTTAAPSERNAFSKSIGHNDALEVALIGMQDGSPAAAILSFRVHIDGAGAIATDSQEYRCPGDCPGGRGAFYLGVHDAIDRMVAQHPDTVSIANVQTAAILNRLEYEERPDVVGGPQTLIEADKSGVSILSAGACAPHAGSAGSDEPATTDEAATLQFRREIEARLGAVDNLVCHEEMRRVAISGRQVRRDSIDADLRIVAGEEAYSDIQNRERVYRNLKDLPGAWSSGELRTILRVTRDSIDPASGIVRDHSPDGVAEIGVRFEHEAADALWTMYVDSRAYPLGFTGIAWFEKTTGLLRRIEWRSKGPAGPARLNISQVNWTVTFSMIEVAGQNILAPTASSYQLFYEERAHRFDDMDARFSAYRRFAGIARMLD